MKRILFVLMALLLVQSVFAISANDAKEDWLDAKLATLDAQAEHQDAKSDFADDGSEENREAVVETGKDVLHAVLDEGEAWLIWQDAAVDENPAIPEDLKEDIKDDVEKNLEKIDEMHEEIDDVDNQLELGLTWLAMVRDYFDLLKDVAKNTGLVWVHLADQHNDKLMEFEEKLREAADDDEDVLELLDEARDALEEAQEDIEAAENAYNDAENAAHPFQKFAQGNSHLRSARINMMKAHGHIQQAFAELVRGVHG